MPPRRDIRSILLIGSGPIIIGQACEFDYSGTQAAKVLRAEGYRVILVNSNPATIMTDPEVADVTYVEPQISAPEPPEISAPEPPSPTPDPLAFSTSSGPDGLRGRDGRGRWRRRSSSSFTEGMA